MLGALGLLAACTPGGGDDPGAPSASSAPSASVGASAVAEDPFGLPVAGLSPSETARFDAGTRLFDEPWTVAFRSPPLGRAPSDVRPDVDGLGPTANASSCVACHRGHGKGVVPSDVMDTRPGLVLRLSIPSGSGPLAEPTYGDQLQDQGNGWAPHEGRVLVTYEEVPGSFADGTPYALRRPTYTIGDLQFGPLADGTMVSPRVAPAVIGLGLLEAIPAEAVLAGADPADGDGDGVSGRPNLVVDDTGATVLGRFGWKASEPTVRRQTVSALHADMGITSPDRPEQNCPAAQTDCAAAPDGADVPGGTEAGGDQVETLAFYGRTLAVPARPMPDDEEARRGSEVFSTIGCASCHRPTWTTGDDPVPALAQQVIQPYTDLLLHDLGDGLADGRPEHGADGREWRTPPLWGIGLVQRVTPDAGFLHDGRARTLAEAVLWHDGEARVARDRFRELPAADRAALLSFLGSL